MTKRFLPFLLVVTLLFLFSCKKDNRSYPADLTRLYYPLDMGHYVVYDVDSTIWNDFDCTLKNFHYQMRYTVTDTFRDNSFRFSYQIYSMVRKNDTSQWLADDVFTVTPTYTGLEVIQNNLHFLKMTFPVIGGASWDGNSMIATNDQDLSYFYNWNYKYTNVGNNYNNGRVDFDNTATVEETDETLNNPDSMVNVYAYRTYSKEVYASEVGLVYRELVHWIYDPGIKPCRKGYGVVMRAIEHN